MHSTYSLSASLSSWDYQARSFSGAELDLPLPADASRHAADRYALLDAAAERRSTIIASRKTRRPSAWRQARSTVAKTA